MSLDGQRAGKRGSVSHQAQRQVDDSRSRSSDGNGDISSSTGGDLGFSL